MQLLRWARWKIPLSISALCAMYAVVGGLLSLSGWVAKIPRLMDWWNTGIVIKPNTALGIMLVSLGLLNTLIFPNARVVTRMLAMFVAVLGALTLFEHITGQNLSIDTLLFNEASGAAATVAPGRMGPPAAFSLLALGTALVFATGHSRARRTSVGLAIMVLSVAILSLTGYLYGADEFYSISQISGVALQTTTMFIALSLSVIASQPDRQPTKTLCEKNTAGVVARRIVPAAFLVPLVLGWVRINGQRAGFYNLEFGTALHTVVEIIILISLSWWVIQSLRIRDIQRNRVEAERRAGEQRLRTVLDAAAVGFTIWTPVKDVTGFITDFRCTYLNPAAAQLLNRQARAIGNLVSEMLAFTVSDPSVSDHLMAVAVRREIRNFELHWNAVGSEGWFQVVASPFEENIAVWFTDITERKQQELDLRNADRKKDEFLATLAHELRNPLAPIRQAAAMANKPNVSHAQQQWCNDVIERNVQTMVLLLDDLLDVARITRGILELRKQPTRLAAVIESAVETAKPLIEDRKHVLNVVLPAEPVVLNIDPLRISQVISNLLINAAKYTHVDGSIRLSASRVNDDLVVSVTDNGVGIAAEQLQQVFEMFSQVKVPLEPSEGGLGIGLALAKGLLELHDGSIEAHSEGRNAGSTFTIRIPNACIMMDEPPRHITAQASAGTPRKILVADDNRDAAESLAMLLTLDGHEVILAHDGEAALALYLQFNPEIVLLDLGMPRLNGHEVARRIRAASSSVVLIAITGWGQSSDRTASAAAGFHYHLIKPVNYDALLSLIANCEDLNT